MVTTVLLISSSNYAKHHINVCSGGDLCSPFFDSRMMRSIICESMPSDRVAMVNQHALRATTQYSLWTTSGKILRKNLRLDAEPFAAFVGGWITIINLDAL